MWHKLITKILNCDQHSRGQLFRFSVAQKPQRFQFQVEWTACSSNTRLILGQEQWPCAASEMDRNQFCFISSGCSYSIPDGAAAFHACLDTSDSASPLTRALELQPAINMIS